MLLVAIPFALPLGHSQPSYSPGVKIGDSVTFGQISARWGASLPAPSYIRLYNETKSIVETVLAVDYFAGIVVANFTFNFKNGTVQSNTLSGSVQDGSGTLGDLILAGSLIAGDPLYQTSYSPFGFLMETTSRLYAGSLRSVNSVNITNTGQYPFNSEKLSLYWDRLTGFLLEVFENFSSTFPNTENFSIHLKVTRSTAWSSSRTADFGFDAIPQSSPFIYGGQSASFTLNLTSVNGFSGSVTLKPRLFNSTSAQPPILSLGQSTVVIPSGGSAYSSLKFSANYSTPAGLYIFFVNGTIGSLSHSAVFAVAVRPPDFQLSAAPSNLTIAQGNAKNSTITVGSLGGFSGDIALSASSYFGLSLMLNPASATLSSKARFANSTLTVSVPSGTVPGSYSVFVSGDNGSVTRSVNIPVEVTGPTFSMSADPSLLTVKQGGTALSTITLTSILGFKGTVNLSSNSYGIISSVSPQNVPLNTTGPATASLTVFAVPGTPPGFYYVTVNAMSGNIARYTSVSVDVVGPDLQISASPSYLTVRQPQNGTSNVMVESIDGLSGTVSLTARTFYPTGLQFFLDPAVVNLTANMTATSKLTISTASAVPGYYEVQVTGINGNLTRYGYLTVIVAGPDFTLSTNPSTLTVREGVKANVTIGVKSILGFSGSVGLSALAFYPPGLQLSLNPSSVNLSSNGTATSTLTVSTAYASPGYYSVRIDGNSGSLAHSTYVYVRVIGPDFTINASPSFFSIKEGQNASSTVTLKSVLGFSGTVHLTATNYFNGPTILLSPANVPLAANASATSTMTISTASANPGMYFISIQAVNGSLTHYTYVNVNVMGPDFGISPDPSFLIIGQGQSAQSTITLRGLQMFNGTIYLSTFTFFSGISSTINPGFVTLSSANPAATAQLNVTVSKYAPTGSYYSVVVTGNSSRLSRSYSIPVTVVSAPDFSINATSTVEFNIGATGKLDFTLTPSNRFNGSVALKVSSSPAGLSANCPTSLSMTNASSVEGSCTLSSNSPGTYVITIVGKSGTLTHTYSSTVHVGDFEISVGNPVNFNSGASGSVSVSLSGAYFSGSVKLSGSGATALTVTCPADPIVLTNDTLASCTVSSSTAGTYLVTIRGTGSPGNASHSVMLVVHVGEFTISVGSGSFNSGANGASIPVSLTSTFGFTGGVTLTSAANPTTGLTVTCPATAVTLTTNGTTQASCALGSTTLGSYAVTVTGTGSSGTMSHSYTATVHVGDFAISLASPVDFNSGAPDVSIAVSLTSLNNFAGAVSLDVHPSSGLTVNCPSTASSIIANATLTVTCGLSSNTGGTYSLTITGSGSPGTVPHAASRIVHVGVFTFSVATPVNFIAGSAGVTISARLTSQFNFAGTVVLGTLESPSTGLEVICPAVSLAVNITESVSCSLNSATAGTYLVSVTAAESPGTQSLSAAAIVQVEDFTVSAGQVTPGTIHTGDSAKSAISIVPINGFTGPVTLAVSPPTGLACSLDHTSIQLPITSQLSCTGNAPGNYTITITAIDGGTYRETRVTFRVVSTPPKVSTSSTTMFGLDPMVFYGLTGVAALVGVGAGLAVFLRRRKL